MNHKNLLLSKIIAYGWYVPALIIALLLSANAQDSVKLRIYRDSAKIYGDSVLKYITISNYYHKVKNHELDIKMYDRASYYTDMQAMYIDLCNREKELIAVKGRKKYLEKKYKVKL